MRMRESRAKVVLRSPLIGIRLTRALERRLAMTVRELGDERRRLLEALTEIRH
jgi:hypothetical protein